MPPSPLLTTDDLHEIGNAAFDGHDPRVVVADLVDAVEQGRLADKTDARYALILAAEIMEQAWALDEDPHVVSFSPMHHWTEQKIRVHVFYCVPALAVAHLMRRHADQAGLHMSVRKPLAELGGIGETVLLYHDGGKGRPREEHLLTDMTATQKRLADLFNIHRHAPTR